MLLPVNAYRTGNSRAASGTSGGMLWMERERLRGDDTMFDCTYVTREMLDHPIDVRTEPGRDLNFSGARALADEQVRKVTPDPMLLAWFDKKEARFSPNVTCCGDDKPTWLIYAESCGGDISVDVNDEEYVFVYRGGLSSV